MRICKVNRCNNILKNSDGNICQTHRSRWHKYKDYEYISPKWTMFKKNQPCLMSNGYIRIRINGKRVLQHRYIMEKYLKRKLNKNEIVHHKNKIRHDNRIENLELIKNQSNHVHKHHRKKPKINWSKYNVPNRKTKAVCLIDNCEDKAKKRDLCLKHYLSFLRNYNKKHPR